MVGGSKRGLGGFGVPIILSTPAESRNTVTLVLVSQHVALHKC